MALPASCARIIRRFDKRMSKKQYEQLKHVNMLPPGRLRVGLFQTLQRHGLRRDVAVSVTHFLAIPEISR